MSPAGSDVLVLHAGDRSLDDLLSVAAAAARSRTRLRLTGVKAKPIEDLMRIVVLGGDCVVLEPDREAVQHQRRRSWFSRG